MPIVAMCPYCHTGGVRAPDRAIGQSATCPRCRSSFTIVPTEQLPGRPVEAYEVAKPSRPRKVSLDETKAIDTADVTEPSPVLPPDPPPAAALAPAASASTALPTSLSTADPALVLALTGACLFGLGMLATLFPFGRIIGLALCGMGLLLGLACLLAEGRTRIVAGAGAALNSVAVISLLFLPGWLGLTPWNGDGEEAEEGPKVPVALEHGTGNKVPADWVAAERASWEFDDIRVTANRALVGPVDLVGPEGAKKRTPGKFLQIPIQLTNTGAQRRIEISGWAAGADAKGVRLTDHAGKTLTQETFEPGWEPAGQVKPNGLFPRNSAELILVFELPTSRVEHFKLELDGAALGIPHSIRFRVPPPLLVVGSPRRK